MSKDDELRRLRYDAAKRIREDRHRYTLERFALVCVALGIPETCNTTGHAAECSENPSRLLAGSIVSLIRTVIADEAEFRATVVGGR